MTSDKAQKRAIRARMAKTGERYTSARIYLLDLHRDDTAPGDAAAPAPPLELVPEAAAAEPGSPLPPRAAEPELGEAAVRRGTDKGWDEWFALLDGWGAADRKHPEIARFLETDYGIDGWWAQTVTVGYERARGLRAVHQRPDGFSVSASKTFPVPVERLHAAFVDEARRARWLEPGTLRLRTAQPGRSARFDVLADGTRLHVYVLAKAPAKSTAQVQLERLPTADAVEERRTFWKERLARLGVLLAEPDA